MFARPAPWTTDLRAVYGATNVLSLPGVTLDLATNTAYGVDAALNALSTRAWQSFVFPQATYVLTPQGTLNGVPYCLRIPDDYVSLNGLGAIFANSDPDATTLLLDNGLPYDITTPVRTTRINGFGFVPSVPRHPAACEVLAPNTNGLEMDRIRFGGAAILPRRVLGSDPGVTANVIGTFLSQGCNASIAGGGRFTNFAGSNYYRAIHLNNTIDNKFADWLCDCIINSSNHVLMEGQVEATDWIKNDFVCSNGSYGPTFILNANSTGQPTTCHWYSTYCDTNACGFQFNAGALLTLTNPWITGGSYGVAVSIPAGSTANGVTLAGGECVFSGGAALEFLAGSGHLISALKVASTCRTTPGGAIRVGGGCTGLTIGTTTTTNSLYAGRFGGDGGQATSGLVVELGATKILAVGNDFSDCGGILDHTGGAGFQGFGNL